jgi:hypothetical protein
LPEVIVGVTGALVVARAVEEFHRLLHNRFRTVKLKLWPYVRRGGELRVNVKETVMRTGRDGETYADEVDADTVFAVLPGYQMLDPDLPPLATSLESVLERIKPFEFGDQWEAKVAALTDEERRRAADTLSRSVKKAKENIAEIEELQKFIEPVAINTLRAWGAHVGCAIPYNYAHNGGNITFGRSDYEMVGVTLPRGIRDRIGKIEFWTDLEPRRRR